MPTSTTPQAEALRAQLALLTAKAVADLRHLVEFDTAAAARRALIRVLPELVRIYGPAAASLSADWYEAERGLVAPKSRFTVAIPEVSDQAIAERTEVLARWSVSPLAPPEPPAAGAPTALAPTPKPPAQTFEPDPEAAWSLVSGGLEKAILDQSRDVLTTAAVDDPAARGWQRAGHGECAFCAMLIGRGAVYTRGTVDFASHNHCRCTAVPAWGGRELPVKPYTVSASRKIGPDGKPTPISPAERERVQRYLRGEKAPTATVGVSSRTVGESMSGSFDKTRTTEELQKTLTQLEKSDQKFSSPGTKARIAELRAEIVRRK